MAAKILEGINQQWKSYVFLLSALTEQGARIAATLQELVAPHLGEGEGVPDFFGTIMARARRLSASMAALVKADHALYAIQARWNQLRILKKENIAWLGEAIVALRRNVQSNYKLPDMMALGLHSPRERRSEPLFRQSDLIGTAFERPDLAQLLGEARYETAADLAAPVAYVKKASAALRTTLDDLAKIQRQHDEALVHKNDLMKEHGELFIYTARSFEADCRLAGEKELARKVRPSESRPGQTEVKPPDTGEPAPRPGQDPAPLLLTGQARADVTDEVRVFDESDVSAPGG